MDNQTQQRSEADEDALMQRAALGDEHAMARLYGLVANALYTYLRRLGCDANTADDVLQTTFLNAWRSRERFRGDGARAWLFVIARNAWFKQRQGNKDDRHLQIVSSAPATPSEQFAATDLARRVDQALSQLEASQREAIILSRVSGLSTREIAGVLEISEGNVRVRLHRGLAKLKETVLS